MSSRQHAWQLPQRNHVCTAGFFLFLFFASTQVSASQCLKAMAVSESLLYSTKISDLPEAVLARPFLCFKISTVPFLGYQTRNMSLLQKQNQFKWQFNSLPILSEISVRMGLSSRMSLLTPTPSPHPTEPQCCDGVSAHWSLSSRMSLTPTPSPRPTD